MCANVSGIEKVIGKMSINYRHNTDTTPLDFFDLFLKTPQYT